MVLSRTLFGLLVAAQVGYSRLAERHRPAATRAIVALMLATSVAEAASARGRRAVRAVAAAGGIGFAIEVVGVASGRPFGHYHYGDGLGAKVAGVPLAAGAAWAMMARPAWVVAGTLASRPRARVPLAAAALTAWDVFLDPRMAREGYWSWPGGGRYVRDPTLFVAVPSVTEPGNAPEGGESWFVLANAPTHRDGLDWDARAEEYERTLLDRLAARGLDVPGRVAVSARRTPADLERETGAPGGSIYGAAPHGRLGTLGRPQPFARRSRPLPGRRHHPPRRRTAAGGPQREDRGGRDRPRGLTGTGLRGQAGGGRLASGCAGAPRA